METRQAMFATDAVEKSAIVRRARAGAERHAARLSGADGQEHDREGSHEHEHPPHEHPRGVG